MGTAAASAGAAGPSQGLRAGWSSGRTEAGVPRGERTTRPRTRADDRDSELDYLLRLTRHGPGGTLLDLIAVLFIVGQLGKRGTIRHLNPLCSTSSFYETVVTL